MKMDNYTTKVPSKTVRQKVLGNFIMRMEVLKKIEFPRLAISMPFSSVMLLLQYLQNRRAEAWVLLDFRTL